MFRELEEKQLTVNDVNISYLIGLQNCVFG
jgi:hypothetical protein